MAMDLEPLRIDRSQARSRGGAAGRWWIAGGAVVLLLVALAVAFRGALGLAGPPPAVETARVESRRSLQATSARGVAANGYVVAGRRAALSADTPGRIVAMNVTEGSVVSEGDVVARLYSEEYAAALARAEADREAARAAVERSRADVAAARANSSWPAAAKSSVPSSDARISCDSKPAWAKNCWASAACVAVNCVLLPRFRACCAKTSAWVAVAPVSVATR